jgi:hypothetical protein
VSSTPVLFVLLDWSRLLQSSLAQRVPSVCCFGLNFERIGFGETSAELLPLWLPGPTPTTMDPQAETPQVGQVRWWGGRGRPIRGSFNHVAEISVPPRLKIECVP